MKITIHNHLPRKTRDIAGGNFGSITSKKPVAQLTLQEVIKELRDIEERGWKAGGPQREAELLAAKRKLGG